VPLLPPLTPSLHCCPLPLTPSLHCCHGHGHCPLPLTPSLHCCPLPLTPSLHCCHGHCLLPLTPSLPAAAAVDAVGSDLVELHDDGVHQFTKIMR
jgi:hypothetical protein